MPERLSGRALARELGVDERAVRKAAEIGRIIKGDDGKFDLAEAREQWVRSTEPSRSKVQRSADGPRSAVRTDMSERDALALWCTIASLPALAAWHVAGHGGALQLAFDAQADMALDIAGDLRLRGYAGPPITFEAITWADVADEYELAPVDPDVMAADWQRRRDEG